MTETALKMKDRSERTKPQPKMTRYSLAYSLMPDKKHSPPKV